MTTLRAGPHKKRQHVANSTSRERHRPHGWAYIDCVEGDVLQGRICVVGRDKHRGRASVENGRQVMEAVQKAHIQRAPAVRVAVQMRHNLVFFLRRESAFCTMQPRPERDIWSLLWLSSQTSKVLNMNAKSPPLFLKKQHAGHDQPQYAADIQHSQPEQYDQTPTPYQPTPGDASSRMTRTLASRPTA